jgi:hypothetical protein
VPSSRGAASGGRVASIRVASVFSMPLAFRSWLVMRRVPLSRVPVRMRLPLRSRRLAIGMSARTNTQIGS